MIVVLDTDVWVAALRSKTGASRLVLEFVELGSIEAAVSPALFCEYEAVAKRPEHLRATGMSLADVDAVLDVLAARATPVFIRYAWRPQMSDPGDELVLECAVNGQARILLTFNLAHFVLPASRFGIVAMRPGEFLRRWPWPEQAILH